MKDPIRIDLPESTRKKSFFEPMSKSKERSLQKISHKRSYSFGTSVKKAIAKIGSVRYDRNTMRMPVNEAVLRHKTEHIPSDIARTKDNKNKDSIFSSA